MCLYTKNLKFKTAKEDIVCYKVLWEDPHSSAVFTPYREELVEFNKILYPKEKIKTHYFLNGFLLKNIKCLKNIYRKQGLVTPIVAYDEFCIGAGVIHVYATYDIAMKICRSGLFVCKAIIPKGAKYIESPYNYEIGTTCVRYEKIQSW